MKAKGIFTKAFKFVSASIGELIVGGLILGATYCKGYFDAVNEKKKNPEGSVNDKKETEEPVAEAEATESTTGETAPPIEVSSNQPED